ncbi:MAG: TldD/PmbA family protein [Euryarchaeota archaeon]|nr:TldD/PmbA family protein [Euryarchaeota archaeon]
MYNMATKSLELAEKYGADEAEVYLSSSRLTSANIRKNTIEGAKELVSKGIGIRTVINGAIGYASTNITSRIDDVVRAAVTSARVRESDPDWSSLPSNMDYPDVSNVFSDQIYNIDLGECIDLTQQMIEGATSIPDVIVTSGSFSRSIGKQLILNTNGVEIKDQGTAVSGFVDVITTGDNISTAYDYSVSRSLDIDFSAIGRNAADLALRSINGVSIETHRTNVIFHPFAFSDILESTFLPSIDADNVQKGRSSLVGKLGEDITVPKLVFVDDGTLSGGIETSVSDDEGTPSQRTTVVGNGVLDSYLYDSYTAGKDNVNSTGNAVRNSYVSNPSVGIRNFIVEYPPSDIISETDEGVFVNMVIGAHTANSISGDFSVEARNAFTIKDGQIDKPIKSLMISGNIFEMLRNVTGAGSDVKKAGGMVTPSIRIKDVNVVG